MILESKSQSCIWCKRGFLSDFVEEDRSISFGPKRRSNEHIFPQCIGGRVVTPDLCKPCNDRFGAKVDLNLIRDERVMRAAKSLGIDEDEFLKPLGVIKGISSFSDGSSRPGKFKDGEVFSEPKLSNGSDLSISAFDQKFRQEDVKNLKKQLCKKHGAAHEKRVEKLVNAMLAEPTKSHYDPVLNEGLRPVMASTGLEVSIRSDPWKTDWCISKIFFETGRVLFSREYVSYLRPVFERLKDFVESGIAENLPNKGQSIFRHSIIEKSVGFLHQVNLKAGPEHFSAIVTLYGTSRWSFDIPLHPQRPPDFCEEVLLDNPLDRNSPCLPPIIRRFS